MMLGDGHTAHRHTQTLPEVTYACCCRFSSCVLIRIKVYSSTLIYYKKNAIFVRTFLTFIISYLFCSYSTNLSAMNENVMSYSSLKSEHVSKSYIFFSNKIKKHRSIPLEKRTVKSKCMQPLRNVSNQCLPTCQ